LEIRDERQSVIAMTLISMLTKKKCSINPWKFYLQVKKERKKLAPFADIDRKRTTLKKIRPTKEELGGF
jgi:hypothetical protein